MIGTIRSEGPSAALTGRADPTLRPRLRLRLRTKEERERRNFPTTPLDGGRPSFRDDPSLRSPRWPFPWIRAPPLGSVRRRSRCGRSASPRRVVGTVPSRPLPLFPPHVDASTTELRAPSSRPRRRSNARSDFQGPSDPLRTLRNGEALFRRFGPAAAQGDSRPVDVVRKKRKLFPGGRPTSPRSLAPPPKPRIRTSEF